MSDTGGVGVVASADALCELGRAADARELLVPALSRDPAHAEGWLVLARAELMLDDAGAALRAAETAGMLVPGDARPHAIAGSALSELGRHEAAVAAADRAVELEPDRTQWHQVAAMVRLDGGREPRQALAAAHTAVRLAPADPQSHLVLALVADVMDLRGLARRSLRRALELDPLNAVAQHERARIAGSNPLSVRGLAAAATGFASALALDPTQSLSRHGFDQALRTFGVRAAYLTLLIGVAAFRIADYRQVTAARTAAVAGLLVLAVLVHQFLRRLPHQLRRHFYAVATGRRNLPVFILLAAAAALTLSVAFLPAPHVGAAAAGAAFAALTARVWLAILPAPTPPSNKPQ